MLTDNIRIGIIGAGANTRSRHIPGLQAIDGVQIVAVCNQSHESGARVAEQFGIESIHTDWREVVDDDAIDAIVIGTWPYMHCRLTIAALAADKHVMCEARMAMNAKEAHLMRDAARARPYLVAQIVPSPMTLEVDQTIKHLFATGYLGDLLAIELRAGGTFIDQSGEMHWRHDFDLSGYNTMHMGIWYEALLRWVGPATAVTAMAKTFVRMRRLDDGSLKSVRIPEHIDVIGDMACGAQMHMQVSAVTGLSGAPEAYLFGSEATIRYSQNKLFGGGRDDNELEEIEIAADRRGGWRVEDEFISAIRGREEITHTSFEDGVKYMEFTEAALRSVAENRTIHLPL